MENAYSDMLYVLVVIHNKTCSESAACRSLLRQEYQDFRILIFDNSDSDYGIRENCEENGWTYLGGTGNLGLPVAYNSALDSLKAEKAEGHICILDDDTLLKNSFTADVKAAVNNGTADIMLPILSRNDIILSPWREKGRRHFRSFEECATEPESNLLAFNSGMIVCLDVFADYRYDQKQLLDCVDISFLTEMKKQGRKISVVPIFCVQGFSALERPSADAAMKRFRIYRNDMYAYFGNNDLKCRYTLLKRAAHLALIYCTMKPFSILKGNNMRK